MDTRKRSNRDRRHARGAGGHAADVDENAAGLRIPGRRGRGATPLSALVDPASGRGSRPALRLQGKLELGRSSPPPWAVKRGRSSPTA